MFRTIYAQPDARTVAATWDEVRDQLTARFPRIGPFMDGAKAEASSPVVGISPNDAAVIRLVGAVFADMHDEGQSGDRRCLSESQIAQPCIAVVEVQAPQLLRQRRGRSSQHCAREAEPQPLKDQRTASHLVGEGGRRRRGSATKISNW